MQVLKEDATGGRMLGGGATGGEWTDQRPVVTASYSVVTGSATERAACEAVRHDGR